MRVPGQGIACPGTRIGIVQSQNLLLFPDREFFSNYYWFKLKVDLSKL
jgi:hypothetical protein